MVEYLEIPVSACRNRGRELMRHSLGVSVHVIVRSDVDNLSHVEAYVQHNIISLVSSFEWREVWILDTNESPSAALERFSISLIAV